MINKKHKDLPQLSWLKSTLSPSLPNKEKKNLIVLSESSDSHGEKPLLSESKKGWTLTVKFPKMDSKASKENINSWPDLSSPSAWSVGRDQMGDALRALNAVSKLEYLEIQIQSSSRDFLAGATFALELGSYIYKGPNFKFKKVSLIWNKKTLSFSDIAEASFLGAATNLARHLVNMPPNELHPESYALMMKSGFSKAPNVSVEVWDEKRLLKEKCNLILAVGEAASSKPRLVLLRYRPRGAKNKKPIALVGKGITFDSGGLDIKPPQGMRLMKKDMGGSAAVVGAFQFAVTNKLPLNLDVYLALAENAISATAFRPGDVVMARNGKSIEIHNTDAEGRLVLADALDVAQTQSKTHQPEVIVNVATLTGAIKVTMGSQIGGLFSNDTNLSQELFESFHGAGDDCWPMPLYQRYRSSMGSHVADMTNSVDGFGGAITAALFLESFIKEDLPWAHFDIYAWKDSPQGPWFESGGSGQAVAGLCHWMLSKTKD